MQFLSKLFAVGLLTDNSKAAIHSLPTSADKADCFPDRMIFPNIDNDNTNLCTFLAVMEKNDDGAVKMLQK